MVPSIIPLHHNALTVTQDYSHERVTDRLLYGKGCACQSQAQPFLRIGNDGLLLWSIGAANVLEAWAIAGGMIVGGIYAPGGEIFTRDIGRDKFAVSMRSHDAVHTLLDETHYQVVVEDWHVLVVGVRFATAQEIGQVNRQKANSR